MSGHISFFFLTKEMTEQRFSCVNFPPLLRYFGIKKGIFLLPHPILENSLQEVLPGVAFSDRPPDR
ncbi:MAG: hypothetical protein ABJN43_15235, partial [Sneathiella sp.]